MTCEGRKVELLAMGILTWVARGCVQAREWECAVEFRQKKTAAA
jgi:hypothetical protein